MVVLKPLILKSSLNIECKTLDNVTTALSRLFIFHPSCILKKMRSYEKRFVCDFGFIYFFQCIG